MRDPRDADGWQAEALTRRVKYARIVRRELRGRGRWYVQLVLEGIAPERRLTGSGAVGLDIGPSTIAMVSDGDAALEGFCPQVEQPWKDLRKVERAMDRSQRATNPECFNSNGTWKKGAKARNKSVRYQRLAIKRRERERRLASERKRAHGELANRILGQGAEIHLEKLSHRGFQGSFGRSTKVRAAGAFVAVLARKVEALDGSLIEINTRKTALSQFDHTTGEFVKKPLSQRTHHFGDGITAPVQRDLYSAFLARHCGPEALDIHQAIQAWPSAEPLLRRAMSRETQSASGQGFGLPQALRRLRADRPSKVDGQGDEAGDVVAHCESPGEFSYRRHQNHAIEVSGVRGTTMRQAIRRKSLAHGRVEVRPDHKPAPKRVLSCPRARGGSTRAASTKCRPSARPPCRIVFKGA